MRVLFYSNYYVSYSYGIQIEYEFINILRRVGYEAYNLVFDQVLLSMEIPEKYKKQIIINLDNSFEIKDDDICIYTDVVPRNPLNAKRVVRFLLNRPYNLTGEGIEYGASDYIMAYSGLVSDKLQKCFILRDEVSLFRQLRYQEHDKSKVVIYFGKVDFKNIQRNYQIVKPIINQFTKVEIITREVPTTRRKTLSVLSDASLLISFDPLTNLNYEATLLGVPVYMFKDYYGLITNNYFKYHGITNDLFAIDKAGVEVDKAWPQYEKWIAGQEEMVKNRMKRIVKHFKAISSKDLKYISKVESDNAKQKDLDYKLFSSNNSIEFTNILKPEHIPEPIRSELLGATYSKGFNWHNCKEIIKKILKKIHLLNFAKKIKNKMLLHKSKIIMREK